MKTTLKMKAIARIVALASVGAALSGCVYDVGLGYASDGYYDDAYGCDPYNDYDRYYDCDYGHGFSNIGYGGGWYDNYYYPGYGFFLFDNIGRRYPMRDHHRRYWGEKRHNWYRDNRGRDGDGGRYQRRNRGYTDGSTQGAIGWPERHGGRVRDGDDIQRPRDGRRDGRRVRNDQWRGGDGRGADAVPVPNPEAVLPQGQGRNRGDGFGGRGRISGDADANAPAPRQRGGRDRQPSPPSASGQESAPVARPMPAPEAERPRPVRQRVIEGAVERPQ
jgi:hypothetical protein